MARTASSLEREAGYTSQIPAAQRRQRNLRISSAGCMMVSALSAVDSFTHAAISRFLNHSLLEVTNTHLPTDNITASRLAIAGIYVAAGLYGAIGLNRGQGRIQHLESMAAGEAQADRQATAVELALGQLPVESVVSELGPPQQA